MFFELINQADAWLGLNPSKYFGYSINSNNYSHNKLPIIEREHAAASEEFLMQQRDVLLEIVLGFF